MNNELIHFRKFGGSYQFVANTPESLKFIKSLDASLWAAVSIPVEAFNCDRDFLNYLDCDGKKRINPSDVRAICSFVEDALKDPAEIDGQPKVERKNLRSDNNNAKCVQRAAAVFSRAKAVELETVATALSDLKSTALKGDGKLRAEALDGKSLELFNDIIRCLKIEDKSVDERSLDYFLTDCSDYLQWRNGLSRNDLLPAGRSIEAFEIFKRLEDKIDNYFAICHLLKLDESNAARFKNDPELPLPPLDIKDNAAISDYLKDAQLAAPAVTAELKINEKNLNPAWLADTMDFGRKFKIKSLNFAQWREIKHEFAPYINYLQDKKGAAVECLTLDKIKSYTRKDKAVKHLRKLFVEDKNLQDKISDMEALHKLLLCCRDLQSFVNNFVSFAELFNKNTDSMLKSGRVIIGGRNYDLTVKVTDPALHKKLSAASNICTMYLSIDTQTPGKKFFIATAVTSGSARDLYVGKRGIFIPSGSKEVMEAQISDLVLHPVSFIEALLLPFVKMREFFSSRFEKFTTTKSKAIESGIDKNISTAAKTGNAPASAGAWLLGGSVGIAAVGSSFAFLIKSLKEVSLWRVLLTLLVITLVFSLPLVINAIVKLRRRNLARFFEAAQWAVNLHMRLSRRMGLLFSFRGKFPKNSRLTRPRGEVFAQRILLTILLVLLCLVIYLSYFNK